MAMCAEEARLLATAGSEKCVDGSKDRWKWKKLFCTFSGSSRQEEHLNKQDTGEGFSRGTWVLQYDDGSKECRAFHGRLSTVILAQAGCYIHVHTYRETLIFWAVSLVLIPLYCSAPGVKRRRSRGSKRIGCPFEVGVCQLEIGACRAGHTTLRCKGLRTMLLTATGVKYSADSLARLRSNRRNRIE